jgi:hypothetical protein
MRAVPLTLGKAYGIISGGVGLVSDSGAFATDLEPSTAHMAT